MCVCVSRQMTGACGCVNVPYRIALGTTSSQYIVHRAKLWVLDHLDFDLELCDLGTLAALVGANMVGLSAMWSA